MATKKSAIVLQYGDKAVSYDELTKRLNKIWTGEMKRKSADLKAAELYVKPEEGKVYFVVNDGEETGDFEL